MPLHCAQAHSGYSAAVEASIATGGCTVSRATLAGACFGSLGTESTIPAEWLASTSQGARLQELAKSLVALREVAAEAAALYCKKFAEGFP